MPELPTTHEAGCLRASQLRAFGSAEVYAAVRAPDLHTKNGPGFGAALRHSGVDVAQSDGIDWPRLAREAPRPISVLHSPRHGGRVHLGRAERSELRCAEQSGLRCRRQLASGIGPILSFVATALTSR